MKNLFLYISDAIWAVPADWLLGGGTCADLILHSALEVPGLEVEEDTSGFG